MPKITGILECFNSSPDNAGNRYWAFRYTEVKSGLNAFGTLCGGESNVNAIRYAANGGRWDGKHNFFCTSSQLPKRDFRYLTSAWQHAGCAPEDLWKFIQKELKAKRKAIKA